MMPRPSHEAADSSATPLDPQGPLARSSDNEERTPLYQPSAPPPEADFLDPPSEPGDLGRLGHYRILRELGKGGMGVVYHAVDTRLLREVAVKVIRRDFGGGAAEERFEREARATAKIKHEHVVEIYHFDRINDVLCLELPLLRGESLDERLKRARRDGRPVAVAEAVKIGREVAEGLAAAHAAGLVHRDIKPPNVFLSEENGERRVRLLDLGLARDAAAGDLTQPGTIVGTPAYMSPEQADGQPLDARSDLFSLGVVLYHLLAGANPFAADTFSATLRRIATVAPPAVGALRPEVPAGLSRLIERLMAKSPQGRPPSARAVADALKHFRPSPLATVRDIAHSLFQKTSSLATTKEIAHPLPGPDAGPRPGRRRLTVGCSLTLTFAILLCAVAVGLWGLLQPAPPRGPALGLQLSLTAMKKGQDRLRSLDEPNVLPLQAGDALRIEARTAEPAYFYVLNLTADGQVSLLYPWRDEKDWNSIAEEKPRDFYCVPDPSKGDAAKLEAGPSGIESVVVLARETPLTAAERDRLRELLQAWPVDQGQFDPLRAAVTIGEDEFRFGDASDQKERGKVQAGDEVESKDPVLRLRRLLQGDVRSLGVASRGVCYTFKGE